MNIFGMVGKVGRSGIYAALFLIASCGPTIQKDYILPQNDQARICVAQCNQNLQFCRNANNQNYQNCQNNYNLMIQNYRSCADAGGKNCIRPQACFLPSNYQCSEDYDRCFTLCGGQIQYTQLPPR
jgi:hypothetical protein